jgi:hypothetical protein
LWQVFASVPKTVKVSGKIVKIESEAMGLMCLGGSLDNTGELSDAADQRDLSIVIQPV